MKGRHPSRSLPARPRRALVARPILLAVPILLAGLALAACDSPAAVDAASDLPRIGPGVIDALNRDGQIRVMVALRPAPGTPLDVGQGDHGPAAPDYVPDATGLAPVTRLDTRRAQVDALVTGVLGRVDRVHVDRRFATIPALAVTVRDTATLARLAGDEAVVRVDLEVGGTGALATSVPRVGADRRHARGNDGAGIVLAILDTGVDTDHPSLAGRVIDEACFGRIAHPCHNGQIEDVGPGAAEDDAGHGTHVSGIMISDGTVGAPGMAPAGELVAVKVMYNCRFSGCFDSLGEIVSGLDYLITYHDSLGTRVVNMSLGTNALYDGVCDEVDADNMAMSAAINGLRDLGVITVVSSMNDGSSTQMASPACLENTIAVAAIDQAPVITSFSNTNAYTDLAAPGVWIVSLGIGGGTQVATGTSMAAPHAAGCVALLAQDRPGLDADGLVARLLRSAETATDPKNGQTMPVLDCSPDTDAPDPRTTVEVPRPR